MKAGGETDILHDTPARIRGFAVFADAWLKGLISGDQRRPMGKR